MASYSADLLDPNLDPPDGHLEHTTELDLLADVVSRLRRALRRQVRVGLPAEALSVAQVEIMQTLADHPGQRASELGKRLLLAPTTISTLLGQLRTKHAIDRRVNPDDQRVWTLHLTGEGRTQLGRWQYLNKQVLNHALSQLNARDRRAIRNALPALEHLVAYLDEGHATR